MLDPTFQATNSATITLSGTAGEKQTIKLYKNNDYISDTTTEKKGLFVFEDIRLSKGENSFKVKAVTEQKKESTLSEEQIITYLTEAPMLEIEQPSDGQSFSKDNNPITVKGKTNPNVKVTVNSLWAIIDNEGIFSYTFRLQNGENILIIVATDQAGNKTESSLKVTYSQ